MTGVTLKFLTFLLLCDLLVVDGIPLKKDLGFQLSVVHLNDFHAR